MKNRLFQILIVLWMAVACVGCDSADIAFAKKTFTYLVRGRYAARGMIDWEKLSCQGKDVGVDYKALDTQQRLEYERSFIDYFKQGFESYKGSLKNIEWTMFGKKGNISVVCARNPKQQHWIILTIIEHKPFRSKMVGLHVMQVFDEQKLEEFRREQLS